MVICISISLCVLCIQELCLTTGDTVAGRIPSGYALYFGE